MLSAVVIDRSSDPSADAIDVSTSGSNTLISVNGTNVYTGASSSISSLSITGTAYNDTISFDYTNGNPVPNGPISVAGGGGTDTLAASAGSDMTLGSADLEIGTSGIDTTGIADAVLNVTAANVSVSINGWLASATVNLGASTSVDLYAPANSIGNSFYAHPQSSVLHGTGYWYGTNGIGYVTAYGGGIGSGDVAGIDDYDSPGNAVLGIFGSIISGTGYDVDAEGFANVTAAAYYSSDTATMDFPSGLGAEASMSPTYSEFHDPGAAFYETALSYTSVLMTDGGPSDTVSMNDSGSSGNLYTHPLSSNFTGPHYSNTANGFGTVTATSYNSSDIAYMDDNGATGASNFYSFPGYSYWQGNTSAGGYVTKENGFKSVSTVAFNSGDYAWLTDNVGGAFMYNNGAINMGYSNGTIVGVNDFGGYANPHISAYNTAPGGQYDTAQSVLQPFVVFYGNWNYV